MEKMKLAQSLPALEEYSIAENENELRDGFANRYYLHQSPSFYKNIASTTQRKLSVEDAYRKAALSEMSMEEKEEFAQVAFAMGLDRFSLLDPSLVTENPYYKLLLGLKEKKVGNLRFFTRKYEPYEVFLYDEQYADALYGSEILPLGYYKQGLPFPALEKGGQVWMSLIPHEILTMAKPIEEAKGKVLVLGIGLGYFAYMVSEKEEVTNVTLVENDPAVISLFESALLPLFPHKEKIEIIKGDGIAYAKNHGQEYDYAFVDIYHNEEDGLPIYLKMVGQETCPTAYWIENSLLLYFRRYVIGFLEEQYDGYTEEAYIARNDFPSALFGALYDATKEGSLKDDHDVLEFLRLPNVKALAKTLKLKNKPKA